MQSRRPSTDATGAWSMRSAYSGWPLELGVRVSVTPSPLGFTITTPEEAGTRMR